MPDCQLTVVILTFNEEIHIERAIRSVQNIATRVVVIDSYSKDRTVELASSVGAIVLQHPFVNQAKQFQWALENAEITTDWVMRLDADEVIESDLVAEISEHLPLLPPDVVGINLCRKHIFMGRWVRHGGRYPLTMLRIWRNGHGRVEDRWMDEHIVVLGGRTVTFKGGFADHNLNDLSYFTDKHNKYSTREAIQVLGQRYGIFNGDHSLTADSASRQAAVKRFIKDKIYNRIPFTFGALMYFLWRYLFQLGFLDGRSGLVYHFLQGYWYRFLVGSKIMELEQAISHLKGKDEIARKISRLTGYTLID